MSEAPKVVTSLDDLVADPLAPNRGTDRGAALLEESIDKCGLGRSIVVDKHGVVIAGNKALQAARKRGAPVAVVQATGQELIAVQRTDLHLYKDQRARQLAYYDNRVGELDLAWDAAQVQQDMLAGVELERTFFPTELPGGEAPEPVPVLQFPDADDDEPSPVPPVTVVEEPEESEEEGSDPTTRPRPAPLAGRATIVFATPHAHLRWNAFMRALRDRYLDEPSAAARLFRYLQEAEGLG